VFYALAYANGARFGELFNLTWVDIDFERGRAVIQGRRGTDEMPPFSVKHREARSVQLPTETVDLLAQYQQDAPEGAHYIVLVAGRYSRVLEK
jgi:integrase